MPTKDPKRLKKMERLYARGFSLRAVGRAFGMTGQSVRQMFMENGIERRTVRPLPFIEFCGRKYSLGVGGYYRATEGDRAFLHREVWSKSHGSIPESYEVHHLDENKENNLLKNLRLVSKEEHGRMHNPSALPTSVACSICSARFNPQAAKRKSFKTCGAACYLKAKENSMRAARAARWRPE